MILEKLIREGTIKYADVLCGEMHDVKIESQEVRRSAEFVRAWLAARDRKFYLWEPHEVKEGLVERPSDMRRVAGWRRPDQ